MLKKISILLLSVYAFGLLGCNEQTNNQKKSTENKTNTTAVVNSDDLRTHNEFSKSLPQNAPVLKVATEALLIPFEFRDEQRNIIGYDVDLIHAIASEQGMRVEILDRAWDGILEDLSTKQYDLVIGAVGMTAEKQGKYEFSDAYSSAPNAMATLENSKISTAKDLTNKSIGILAGGESYFNKYLNELGAEEFNITEYKTLYLALKDLIAGNIDAIVGDKAILSYHTNNLEKYPLKIVELSSSEDNTNIFFVAEKGNIDLINKINQGLEAIKKNGIYNKINKKWFGH